jgi:hypothetical protein
VVSRVSPSGIQVANTTAPVSFGNGIAGGWLLYLVKTSAQTGFGATEATVTNMSGSCTVNSGRRILIIFSGETEATVADTTGIYRIKEDGVLIKDFPVPQPTIAGGPGGESRMLIAQATPSAGTHTYSLTLQRTTGTGSLTEKSNPGFLMVLDVGPA